VELVTTFRPEILLDVSFGNDIFTGGVGAFFDIPKVSAKIKQLTNVDENCKPVGKPVPVVKEVCPVPVQKKALGNFTNIQLEIELNVGAVAELDVAADPFDPKIRKEATLVKTSFMLPTACLPGKPREGLAAANATAVATGTGVASASVATAFTGASCIQAAANVTVTANASGSGAASVTGVVPSITSPTAKYRRA
jgi:hypothetical protein